MLTAKSLAAPPRRVAADPEAGLTLIAEAVQLIELRRWKPALRVLESAVRLRPDDPAIDELTLIAAAHGHRRSVMKAAAARIAERDEQSASSYHAQAVAALAEHRYQIADGFARQSIESDPGAAAGWVDLATAFAGLGWFDQSTDCLLAAEHKGGITPTQQWRLGRAVNYWALTRTPALIVTAVATLLVGLLALAVGLSTPILLREVRVGGLDEPFKSAAQDQWRTEHRIKIGFGLCVLVSVIGFVASLMLYNAT